MSTINHILAANLPNDASLGDMYFETDTNKIALWDGTVWRKFNPDSPVVNNNTNAGSGNEIGSAYSAGIMRMTLGTEWPASSDSDLSNHPYVTLPDSYGSPGETVYLSGYDYAGEAWGWVDGVGGGQVKFGDRIYSLTDRTASGEADIPEYITDWTNVMGNANVYSLEDYIANYQDITYLSMQVLDVSNYVGYGAHSLYCNNNGRSFYGFTALTWKHGSSDVIVKLFIEDDQNGNWVCYDLYVFDVGTVPAYDSTNPVSLQPTSVTVKNAGGSADSTYTFSSGAPTFELTPAVFTS